MKKKFFASEDIYEKITNSDSELKFTYLSNIFLVYFLNIHINNSKDMPWVDFEKNLEDCIDYFINVIDLSNELVKDQLNKFEFLFHEYLMQQVICHEGNEDSCAYDDSRDLGYSPFFSSLFGKSDYKEDDFKNLSLINFNYTPCVSVNVLAEFKSFYHIHGAVMLGFDDEFGYLGSYSTSEIVAPSLFFREGTKEYETRFYKSIIFGIDDIIDDKDNKLNSFKKSFRILQFTKRRFFKLPSNENIESISFFGHGLGESDFSNFQAIFDNYEIYSSSIKLDFYYVYNYPSNGRIKTQEDALSEQVNNSKKMFDYYSNSFYNKNVGQSLFKKLILENRINFIGLRTQIKKSVFID